MIFLAREQHIRREKATSNICTSQALLANMAAMYAVYHGPIGLQRIAEKVHFCAQVFKASVEELGFKAVNDNFFDTVTLDVSPVGAAAVHDHARRAGINLRIMDDQHVGVTFDESISVQDLTALISVFGLTIQRPSKLIEPKSSSSVPDGLKRTSEFLQHPVFNRHHSETEMMRYMNHLASKDIGLVHSMIPLGSCTMKLNSTSSMIPLTWPEFSAVHPFAPRDQVKGYLKVIEVRCSFKLAENITKLVPRNWKTIFVK